MKGRSKILVFLIALTSCSPVKRVLRDADMYAQVRDSVIARGDCHTEDRVVIKDSLIPGPVVKVPCGDFIDTVHDVVIKDSLIRIAGKVRIIERTKWDLSLEKAQADTINKLRGEIAGIKGETYIINKKHAEEVRGLNKKIFKLWLAISAITLSLLVWIFRKPILLLLK